MSDEKDSGFIARWSRRKQEAAADSDKRAEDKNTARSSEERVDKASEPQQSPPAVDLTKLPSLESIDAQTDMRVFLQAGVPADLTRAALRRAWAADPAIRDFIGLSENSFDFNSPDLPGFGPLDPDFDVKAFATRVFEGSNEKPSEVPIVDATEQQPAAPSSGVTLPASEERGAAADPAERGGPTDEAHAARAEDIAVHPDEPPVSTPAHRHGSALPKTIT